MSLFDREKSIGQKAYFICHEGVPAGVLLGSDNNGTFEVNIDYTTTAYRDCSVAKYLYSKIPDDNVKKLRFSHVASEAHKSYMAKMGYVFKDGAYEKTV